MCLISLTLVIRWGGVGLHRLLAFWMTLSCLVLAGCPCFVCWKLRESPVFHGKGESLSWGLKHTCGVEIQENDLYPCPSCGLAAPFNH